MATRPPANDPSQRLPWIVLAIVVLLVVIVAITLALQAGWRW